MTSLPWMAECAPTERDFLEAFFLWIYTGRAHDDGTVRQIIDESLDFPHKATPHAIRRTLDAFRVHATAERLHRVAVPTLVMAGGEDIMTPPRYGRVVADLIPGAQFEVWGTEAHQPFQEVPDAFNTRVDTFWRQVSEGV